MVGIDCPDGLSRTQKGPASFSMTIIEPSNALEVGSASGRRDDGVEI